MKKKPIGAQCPANTAYAGGEELWQAERFLVNYNNDLVLKLISRAQGSERVLEFGAGIGTLANIWHEKTGVRPDCVEIDDAQKNIVESRGFVCHKSVKDLSSSYDVVYSSNVLEHIDDDLSALKSLRTVLNKDGRLLVYVPAFMILYSDLDEKIGHYRRYEKKDLVSKLETAGFEVRDVFFCDCIGFFAWAYQKMVAKGGSGGIGFYDSYIYPVSCLLDFVGFRYFFGKNIFVLAVKI